MRILVSCLSAGVEADKGLVLHRATGRVDEDRGTGVAAGQRPWRVPCDWPQRIAAMFVIDGTASFQCSSDGSRSVASGDDVAG
ncbi:MAG: hypothetical protein ACODAD_07575 [Planctomycetota bacterium]